jgi:hypothetical protein
MPYSYCYNNNHDSEFFAVQNLSGPFDLMRFYLVYRGQLSATQGKRGKRSLERQEIRKQISPQLKRLWEVNRSLIKLQWDARVPDPANGGFMSVESTPLAPHFNAPPQHPPQEGFIDLCLPMSRGGKKFRPLVRTSLDLTCSLNILFLRQEDPGAILKKAGDIDNRIKTFIDALEMPDETDLDGDETDDLNYRLLENDTLVRGLEIDSERLLLPEKDFPNQVHLVIHVERVGPWNVCLL